MKVIVCGSRDWADYDRIRSHLAKLPPKAIVITGGARGVDRFANAEARKIGLARAIVEPNWQRHGHAAGPHTKPDNARPPARPCDRVLGRHIPGDTTHDRHRGKGRRTHRNTQAMTEEHWIDAHSPRRQLGGLCHTILHRASRPGPQTMRPPPQPRRATHRTGTLEKTPSLQETPGLPVAKEGKYNVADHRRDSATATRPVHSRRAAQDTVPTLLETARLQERPQHAE